MAKFEKGNQRGFKKGQSGNPGGKTAEQVAAEASLHARTVALADAGVTPVEVMLITMRDLWAEANLNPSRPLLTKRMQAIAIAEKVAPYVHPKLATTQAEVTGKDGTPLFSAVVQYQLPSNGRDAQ